MADHQKTDIVAAFNRVLDEKKETLRSKNNWRVLAGIPKTTALGAFAGKNPTMDTLEKLAAAAGLTVGEMLEYGDPDWHAKVRARSLISKLTDAQLLGLIQFLEGQTRNG